MADTKNVNRYESLAKLSMIVGIDCMVLAVVFLVVMIAVVAAAQQLFALLVSLPLAFVILGVVAFVVMAILKKKAKALAPNVEDKAVETK